MTKELKDRIRNFMTKPLSEDIAYAISCVQDHRDTIDTDTEGGRKLSDDATRVINRLLSFYYQLTGYDPSEAKT